MIYLYHEPLLGVDTCSDSSFIDHMQMSPAYKIRQ